MSAQLRKFAWVCLAWAVFWVAPAAVAERVENLYTQAVLVPNQSPGERKAVAGVALQQVLQRISGSTEVAEQPKLLAAIARAESYLESFHYESSEELIDYQGQEVQASRLVLEFSGATLEKLLREAQLPVWPANRPSILVWLVVDDATGKRLVQPFEELPITQSLPKVAANLGLPISQPLFDLQDQMALDVEALWRLDREAIRSASSRYRVDAVLVGRYSQTSSGLWLGSWALEHKNRQNIFDSQAMTDTELLANGLQQVAGHLASLYGVVSSGMPANALALELRGIKNFADYMQSLEYLNKLAIVSHVAPMTLQGESISLIIHVEGDTSVLMDTLALDRRLQQIKQFDNQQNSQGYTIRALPGSLENPLKFSWAGASR